MVRALPKIGLATFILTFLPSQVLAAGKSMPGGLTDILILLAFIGSAYAVAHLLLERIAEKFGFVTGVEYILLGILIVYGFELVSPATIDKLTAAIVLGTGSLGLLVGLYLDFEKIKKQKKAFQAAGLVSLSTLFLIAILPGAVAALIFPLETFYELAPGILCMGAVALVAEPSPVRSLIAFLGVKNPLTQKAVATARYCSSFGIFVFGLIFCFFNNAEIQSANSILFWTELPALYAWFPWLVFHLVLGGVLGLVFSAFIGEDFEYEELFTVVIGLVIFSSGIAYYFNLSPIFVNFVLGIVLANYSEHDQYVSSMIQSIRRPLYIILFFFAGARFSADLTINFFVIASVVVAMYLILRRLGRAGGSFLATNFIGKTPYNLGIGRSLLASGALSVAMLLDFNEFYGFVYVDLPFNGMSDFNYVPVLYAGLLISIVISEVLSYGTIRTWLIDNSNIRTSGEESGVKLGDVG